MYRLRDLKMPLVNKVRSLYNQKKVVAINVCKQLLDDLDNTINYSQELREAVYQLESVVSQDANTSVRIDSNVPLEEVIDSLVTGDGKYTYQFGADDNRSKNTLVRLGFETRLMSIADIIIYEAIYLKAKEQYILSYKNLINPHRADEDPQMVSEVQEAENLHEQLQGKLEKILVDMLKKHYDHTLVKRNNEQILKNHLNTKFKNSNVNQLDHNNEMKFLEDNLDQLEQQIILLENKINTNDNNSLDSHLKLLKEIFKAANESYQDYYDNGDYNAFRDNGALAIEKIFKNENLKDLNTHTSGFAKFLQQFGLLELVKNIIKVFKPAAEVELMFATTGQKITSFFAAQATYKDPVGSKEKEQVHSEENEGDYSGP